MEAHHKEALEKLASGIECPRNNMCAESGFEVFGKARDRGLEGYLECMDDFAPRCKFAVHFGSGYYCRCPVRVYAGKKLGKID